MCIYVCYEPNFWRQFLYINCKFAWYLLISTCRFLIVSMVVFWYIFCIHDHVRLTRIFLALSAYTGAYTHFRNHQKVRKARDMPNTYTFLEKICQSHWYNEQGVNKVQSSWVRFPFGLTFYVIDSKHVCSLSSHSRAYLM